MADSKSLSSQKASQHVPEWIVVIGSGAGGPQALSQILPELPVDIPAVIIVVQYMRPGFTRVLANHLRELCKLPVCEPEDGQALLSSRIVICPSNARLIVARVSFSPLPAYCIHLEDLNDNPELRDSRIDSAMNSAAEVFGDRTIGVLLTGLGSDGREGMRAIRESGGLTIAQDQATSVVHAMPSASIEAGVVQEILPLWGIAERIIETIRGQNNAAAA